MARKFLRYDKGSVALLNAYRFWRFMFLGQIFLYVSFTWSYSFIARQKYLKTEKTNNGFDKRFINRFLLCNI